MAKANIIIILFLALFIPSKAQEVLTLDQAISIGLENNLDIRISQQETHQAKNNASIWNSEYLPTLSLDASSNLDQEKSLIDYPEEEGETFKNRETQRYQASLKVDYTLFDGWGRTYNYQALKQKLQLSELETIAVIEQFLVDMHMAYYDLYRLQQQNSIEQNTFELSQERVKRVEYQIEYGQANELDLLNAKVDLNQDKIRYQENEKQLVQASFRLNQLLGREINTSFKIDTTMSKDQPLHLEMILQNAKQENSNIQQINQQIQIAQTNIKNSQSNYWPKLAIQGGYDYFDQQMLPASKSGNQSNYGWTAGLSLSWKIFDSGKTKTNTSNAKIELESQHLQKEAVHMNIEKEIRSIWEDYLNAQFIRDTENQNVITNQQNFNRTQEQYKLGQASSLEFRQAQINLLQASNNLNEARFQIKTLEVILMQLGGLLTTDNNQ